MALIKCRECGREISDTSDKCIHCGCPLNTNINISGEKVSNFYMWILAFLPLLSIFFLFCGWIIFDSYIIGMILTIIFELVFNIALIYLDYNSLKESDINVSSFGKFSLFKIVIPKYIYKRADILKQSLSYFVVWIVCFIVFVISILAIFIQMGLLEVTSTKVQETYLEECNYYTLGDALESYIENATWKTKIDLFNEKLVTVSGQMIYYGEMEDVVIIYAIRGQEYQFKDMQIDGKSVGINTYKDLIEFVCD